MNSESLDTHQVRYRMLVTRTHLRVFHPNQHAKARVAAAFNLEIPAIF